VIRRFSLLVLLALLLAACGGAADLQNAGGDDGRTGGIALPEMNDTFAPLPSKGGDGSALIVTASIALGVEKLDASVEAAEGIVRELGGVLIGSSRGNEVGYPWPASGERAAIETAPATLTFRVPAAELDLAIERLRAIGTLVSERRDATDVSTTLRDLGARLKNLRAAEVNYLRLLERAESVTDLLAVQAQIDGIRGQIEQLAAEQTSLDEQVARSLLSVTLYPPAAPVAEAVDGFNPLAIAADAVGFLLAIARAIATALIWLVVIVVPLALIARLLAWLLRRR
jgi:hypothetical protein